jgi:hypothetical protein
MKRKKHTLSLTSLELLSLVSILDSFSSISDGICDDGSAKKEFRIVDKMLSKNGFKREYN